MSRKFLQFACTILGLFIAMVFGASGAWAASKTEAGDASTNPAMFARSGSLTVNTGENNLLSSVIDPTGGYAYFGTQNAPGKIVKVRLSDFTRVGALTLNTGENDLRAAVIDTAGGYAYFATFTLPTRIVKVRLSDFTRVGAITLNSGENRVYSAVIDPAGGFAYFGTDTSPGIVVKIRLSDFTRIGALQMNAGEAFLDSAVIDPTGGYAYFGTATSPGGVVKVQLSNFSRVGAITFDSGENGPVSALIDSSGDFAYFGTTASPGRIVRVYLPSLQRVDALTLNAGENTLYSGVMDSTRGFMYFGTYTSPARVVKVRTSDFTRVDALTLNAGENSIFSEVIDPTGGFAYFGADTSPAIVVKMDITLALPTVATSAATAITSNSATLNGTVNANNYSTAVNFYYGLTSAYENFVSATPSPVTGNSNTAVSAAISGLVQGATYRYLAYGANADGSTYGNEMTFTTDCTFSGLTVTNANDSGAGSLRQAINDLCPDGTITFGGDYTIRLGSTLNLVKNVTIDATGHTVTVSGDSDNDGFGNVRVFQVSSNKTVNLKGFTITRGYVYGNHGGGIYNNGTLGVTNMTFADNAGYGYSTGYPFYYYYSANGGAVYSAYGSSLTVNASTFVGNRADYGTGIYAGATTIVANSTFNDICCYAVYNAGVALYLTNDTFSGTSGGALQNYGNAHVRNTIMANAPSGYFDCAGNAFATNLNNLIESRNGCSAPTYTADPNLSALGSYGGSTQTFALLAGSPAGGNGDATTCANAVGAPNYGAGGQDQRGVTRPQGAGCDIGAYEQEPALVTTDAATAVTTNSATLKGIVQVKGGSTIVTFEYGLTTSYGATATAAQSPLSGMNTTAVSAALSGLTSSTLYHYRVVGVNAAGTANGGDMTFTTSPEIIADAYDWFWENPLPHGGQLEDIACPTTTLCKAVGEYGVMSSWDGTTWTADFGGTTLYFNDVDCPSVTLCKAVGSAGTIRSWNGSSWSADSSGSGGFLRGIACPSTTLCKAVGASGTILSWNGASWSADSSGTSQEIWGIDCPDAGLCRAVGGNGTILVWNGTSWSAETSGTSLSLYSIDCRSSSECKAVGNSGTILSWNGASWNTEMSGTTQSLNGIACPSSTLCKAVGLNGTIRSWSGSSWSGDTATITLLGVACPSLTLCKAVGSGGAVISWDGTSWSQDVTGTTEFLSDVDCATSFMCKVVTGSGAIRSWNGANWSTEASGTLGLYAIACRSASLCKAVGNNGAVSSWNGTNWSAGSLGITNAFYSIACPSDLLCKAVGSVGVIRSWNGTSWSADTSGTSQYLQGVACPSATLCKAVGDNGTILSWNGTSWSADSSGTSQNLRGIACPSTTLCKAVGDSGTIRAWNGTSWSTETSGTVQGLGDIACPSLTLCKALGGNGTIQSWNGSSWSTDSFITSQGLRSIACASTTLCKAVGFSGAIVGMVGQIHNNVSLGFALDVFNSTGCLNGVTITEVSGNHPNAPASVQTGRYWTITPSGCTSGFSASLTLPSTFTPNANTTVCRYTGSGTNWDCVQNGFATNPNRVARWGVTEFSEWAVGSSAPTAATLTKFKAKFAPKKEVVRVRWETGSELNVVGFKVYRATKRDSTYKLLTRKMVEAKNIGGLSGAKYSFKNKKVKSGKNYFYKIEILRTDGGSEWSDVIKVRVE